MNRHDGEAFFKPYLSRILRCVEDGFNEYIQEFKKTEKKFRGGTAAGILNNLIIDQVWSEFSNDTNIYLSECNRLFLMTIDRKVNLRFNKLQSNLVPSSNSTKQAENYYSQGKIKNLQLDFFESEEDLLARQAAEEADTYFVVGWLLDDTATNIKGVYITFPKSSSKNHWYFDVEEVLQSKIEPVEAPNASVTNKPKRRRIKPREDGNIEQKKAANE